MIKKQSIRQHTNKKKIFLNLIHKLKTFEVEKKN